MTRDELISRLQQIPQNLEVKHLWDGSDRTTIEHVWVSKGGFIVTADCGECCLYDKAMPIDAPLLETMDYGWETPDKGTDISHSYER